MWIFFERGRLSLAVTRIFRNQRKFTTLKVSIKMSTGSSSTINSTTVNLSTVNATTCPRMKYFFGLTWNLLYFWLWWCLSLLGCRGLHMTILEKNFPWIGCDLWPYIFGINVIILQLGTINRSINFNHFITGWKISGTNSVKKFLVREKECREKTEMCSIKPNKPSLGS